MTSRRTYLALWLCALLPAAAMPATAPSPQQQAPYLENVSQADADALLHSVREAQRQLRAGETGRGTFFSLLSGSIARAPMAAVAPREAFLGLDFDAIWSITRLARSTGGFARYRITILPDGPGADAMKWDADITVGYEGYLQRVELFYARVPPF